jgi:hypothetical protein
MPVHQRGSKEWNENVSRVAVESLSFYIRFPQRRQAIESQETVFTLLFKPSDFPPFYFACVKLIPEMFYFIYF